MARYKDLTGQRFGRLVCLRDVGRDNRGELRWLCGCDCGNQSTVLGGNLRSGHIQSCGCWRKQQSAEKATTHGLSKDPGGSRARSRIHGIWHDMKRRCADPRRPAFSRYGGRGIRVCGEWANDFAAFHAWATANGYRDDLSIDRKDNDGDYEPGNCRWITRQEQALNTRSNVRLTLASRTMTMTEWAGEVGMDTGTLHNRIKSGWSVRDALETPVGSVKSSGARPTLHATFRGETKSLKEWARKFGIEYATLYARIAIKDWDVERALTTQTRRCNHEVDQHPVPLFQGAAGIHPDAQR